MVKEHFAAIPAPRSARPRPAFDVPDQPGTLVRDRHRQGGHPDVSVAVYSKMPAARPDNGRRLPAADRRADVHRHVERAIHRDRRRSRSAVPRRERRTRHCSSGRRKPRSLERSRQGRRRRTRGSRRSSPRPSASRGSASPQPELDRQKRNVLRGLERAVAEKDNQQSAPLAAEYIRNFLTGRADSRHRVRERALSALRAGDHARRGQRDGERMGPRPEPRRSSSAPRRKTGCRSRPKRRWRRSSTAAAARTLTAYVETTVAASRCWSRRRRPDASSRRRRNAEFGITEWQLSNGVKVVLKPTTFKQDEVLFRAFSPGGTSLASDADFISADDGGAGRAEPEASATFSAVEPAEGADRQSGVGLGRPSRTPRNADRRRHRRRISRRCSS